MENNNNYLRVNNSNILETKKLMENDYNEILVLLNKYKRIIEESKEIYDTSSSLLFRKIALGYLELIINYLNNDFKPYIDKLDIVKSTYAAINNEIQSIMG